MKKDDNHEKINLINTNHIQSINNYKRNTKNIFDKIDEDNNEMEYTLIDENNKEQSKYKFILTCGECEQLKNCDYYYYCNICQINFCDSCEKIYGKTHEHCYYKIKDKHQENEIKIKFGNNSGKSFNKLNKNNSKNINKEKSFKNSIKEIISESSKFFGNLGDDIKNFFNSKEKDEKNPNELINPYSLRNKNKNTEENIVLNNTELKKKIEQFKCIYILKNINDIDIERALIQQKGNIDKAFTILLNQNNF